LIAAWLLGRFRSAYAIAGYIAFCSVVTLIATSLMTDYTGKDIEGKLARVQRSPPSAPGP
jgi:hypothetical protein